VNRSRRLTTKNPLNRSVCLGDTLSLGGTSGVGKDSDIRTSVDLSGEGSIGKSVVELNRHPLVPDRSGNDVSESTSQVVKSKVKTGDNGNVLVLGSSLNRSDGGVSEETTSDTY
jgi:UDP-3-O-[3-hydroxymyristoyl] glucosamine N-acyltransferase